MRVQVNVKLTLSRLRRLALLVPLPLQYDSSNPNRMEKPEERKPKGKKSVTEDEGSDKE